MNRIVYKISDENTNILENLKVDECCPVEDNNGNKIIINKLLVGVNKLFLETKYLKVIKINHSEKKIYLELPKSHVNFFSELDDVSSILLTNLINGNTNLDINEMFECLNIDLNNLENIHYKSILEENTNILKINVFPNTTIKNNNNDVLSIHDINPGDFMGVVLGLDYISLLVDNDSLLARTKLYCYFIQTHKQYIYKPEQRETISDWNFSSKLASENIFLKTNITQIDNIDVKTETEPIIKSNKEFNRNTSNNFHNILKNVEEKEEEEEEDKEDKEDKDDSSLCYETSSLNSSNPTIISMEKNNSKINFNYNKDFEDENNSLSSNSIASNLILDVDNSDNESIQLISGDDNLINPNDNNNKNNNVNNNVIEKKKENDVNIKTNKTNKTNKINKTNNTTKSTKNNKNIKKNDTNLNLDIKDNNIEKKSRMKKKILIETNENNSNKNNEKITNQVDNSQSQNEKIVQEEENKTKTKKGRKKVN
jgi:hypothetical protein